MYLKELENWLNRWRLKAAIHKCSYIQIENKKSNTNLQLKFYGEKIASDQTFLGIHFDRLINFNQHVTNIVDRANKRLNIIKILVNKKWKLSLRRLVNIYKTLMRSVLEYSAIIIPRLTVNQICKIQMVQNRALRIIYRKHTNSTIDDLLLVVLAFKSRIVVHRFTRTINKRKVNFMFVEKNIFIRIKISDNNSKKNTKLYSKINLCIKSILPRCHDFTLVVIKLKQNNKTFNTSYFYYAFRILYSHYYFLL